MEFEYQKCGSGPPFIYVSGLESSGKLFYKQARDLARDHTVVSFPLRPSGRHTMSDLIDDLVCIVRDVGAERANCLIDSVGAASLIAASLRRAKLKLLEGVGHWALLSSRVRVREWLVEFADI